MKVVIQRVKKAQVDVENETVGKIRTRFFSSTRRDS
jgi:D-Tyr-tRNAtyr deacylase